TGDGVLGRLPGPDVVEGPDTNDVEAGKAAVLKAGEIGGSLARGIGSGRPQRAALIEQLVHTFGIAVDEGTTDGEDARLAAPLDDRVVQSAGGAEVSLPGRFHLL